MHKEIEDGTLMLKVATEPVTQCNARPTVTFPAARHHWSLAGIQLDDKGTSVNDLPKAGKS